MKKITLILLLFVHFITNATTYYVGSTGANFTTIAQVNSATFVAGDSILFNRGEVFTGTLHINHSGTSGTPITYGAYGTGVNPIITGFTQVTAWTNLGNNIWESTNAVSALSTCNMVVNNGVNASMGRYPNSDAINGGYLTFQSHSGSTSITSNSLTGSPDWTGAELVIRLNRFSLNKRIITSQSGSTLNWITATRFEPTNGYGFFIQNDVRTLDQQNEWYYDSNTKKISIYSTLQPTNVQVSSVDKVVDIEGSYVTIDNISITGSNLYSIFSNYSGTVNHVKIQNCNISFSGNTAIAVRCDYLTIENNTILNSNNKGIEIFYSKYSTIRNNTVENTAQLVGMLADDDQQGCGVNVRLFSIGTTIENNRIINTGGSGIQPLSDTILVKNNFIDTFCNVINDLGGIYTHMKGVTRNQTQIQGNIIINGIGASNGTNILTRSAHGIYLDLDSKNVEVWNNTVYNADYGIFITNPLNVNIHDNTCFNNESVQYYTYWVPNGQAMSGNITTSNLFISKASNQIVYKLYSYADNLSAFGIYTENYYCRPIDDDLTFSVTLPSVGATTKTLAQWQTLSSQDINSKKSPQSITIENDLQFEYNATTSAKTVALSVPMIDIKGTKYPYNITLQPYTSAVLIPDNNPEFPPRPIMKNRKYHISSIGEIIMTK